jgi:thiaminase/transcriptional activator TenA
VIGSVLKKTASSDTPYQEWIKAYACNDYQDLCNVLGSMVEKSALARLGNEFEKNPRWDALCKCFNTATRLEIGFWEMGLRGH